MYHSPTKIDKRAESITINSVIFTCQYFPAGLERSGGTGNDPLTYFPARHGLRSTPDRAWHGCNHAAALWAEFSPRKTFVMFARCGNRRMGPLRGEKMATGAHFLSKTGCLEYLAAEI